MFIFIKYYFIFFIVSISIIKGISQNTFQLTIGDVTDERRTHGFFNQDNDLVVFGHRFNNLNTYYRESYIMKFDAGGNILNQVFFSVNNPDYCMSITSVLPDVTNGYIAFAFVSDSFNVGAISRKLRFIKMNNNFEILFYKDYNIPYPHYWYAHMFAQYDNDSTIICTTQISDTISTAVNTNTLLYRFNINGDSICARRISDGKNFPYSLLVTSDTSKSYKLFTAYYIQSIISSGQIVYLDSLFNTIRIDSLPNTVWQNPTSKWLNNNKYITVGKFFWPYPVITPNWQIGALILNRNDSVVTFKHYGKIDATDYPAWLQSLDFINPNEIFIGGMTNFCIGCGYTLSQVNQPFILIKTDSLLNTQFEYFYDFNANLYMWSVIATPDGGCIMLGTIYDWINAPNNKHDIFILKVDANGMFTNTKDAETGKISEAIIGPNPGNDFINVIVAQQIKEPVIFEMFDFTGKKVLQETIQATSNTSINTALLKPGIYFYKIKTSKKEIGSGKWVKI